MSIGAQVVAGAIAHPAWHAFETYSEPSCTPCGQLLSRSEQLEHIWYVWPLTVREQPLLVACASHARRQVPASAPRARIMHACAHESSVLLPTLGSLQQKPCSLHFALHCARPESVVREPG